MPAEGRPAVFLDRDGTVNEEVAYLRHPDQLVLLPGAAEAIGMLRQAGLPVVIITNQSGVARGLISAENLPRIRMRLSELLAGAGTAVDGYYVCPHHPEQGCACRKPAPGLVLQAARELGLTPARSWVVGDNACDVQLGHGVGATTLLVLTGHGRAQLAAWPSGCARPCAVCADLRAAADWILRHRAGVPPAVPG